MEKQLEVFEAQLDLAAELKRPVSVHGVRCPAKLFQVFQERAKGLSVGLSSKERRKKYKEERLGGVEAGGGGGGDDHHHAALSSRNSARSDIEPSLENTAALNKWPPAIMLHSFSGSPDLIKSLLKLPSSVSRRFYFSFSRAVNCRTACDEHKTLERIACVPDDRVLIESDLHDMKHIDAACLSACEMVARAKGWASCEAARLTGQNARSFLLSSRI